MFNQPVFSAVVLPTSLTTSVSLVFVLFGNVLFSRVADANVFIETETRHAIEHLFDNFKYEQLCYLQKIVLQTHWLDQIDFLIHV